jgi:hypothetical protein
MKKLSSIILVVLILLGHNLIGQDYFPFPDTNSAWNTVGDNDFTSDEWHFRYAVFGDTIINSTLYTKIYKMYDSTILHPNSTYFAAIRENENKQVFCLIPGFSESILYDFNLNVGDTIFYNIGGGLYHNEVDFWDENHYKIVSEKDSMLLLNNQYRRKWVYEGTMGYQTWIEGIGSISWYGLFNPLITAMLLNGDGYQFACFKENDTVLYLNNMFCDQCFCQLYTGLEEQNIRNEKSITLFPNPACDKITIQINETYNSICKLEIFDLFGKKQIEKTISFNNEIEIELENLKDGIYLIKIYSLDKKLLGIKKLVIEQ